MPCAFKPLNHGCWVKAQSRGQLSPASVWRGQDSGRRNCDTSGLGGSCLSSKSSSWLLTIPSELDSVCHRLVKVSRPINILWSHRPSPARRLPELNLFGRFCSSRKKQSQHSPNIHFSHTGNLCSPRNGGSCIISSGFQGKFGDKIRCAFCSTTLIDPSHLSGC